MAKKKATKSSPKKTTRKTAHPSAADRRTAKIQDLFLAELAAAGNIAAACRATGVSRSTVYNWRQASSDFAARFTEAMDEAIDSLEAEAWRRGRDGVAKPIFYQGEVCGHIQEYSDRLLILLLQAHRPERFRPEILPPKPPPESDSELDQLTDGELETRAAELAREAGYDTLDAYLASLEQ